MESFPYKHNTVDEIYCGVEKNFLEIVNFQVFQFLVVPW